LKNQDISFLLAGIKQGNISSLEKLYKIYYAKLFWFAKKFDSSTLETDDFVQETFLKLWEQRERLKDDVLFDKQLFIICKNIILNHLKRESKTVGQVEEISFPKDTEAEDLSLQHIRLEKLHHIISMMPPKRGKIFLLHRIENLTYEEIAQYLNISTKTIANHLYLATKFIKEELRNN